VAVGEKHDVLTQRLASSPLISSAPSSLPSSLGDACSLACLIALEDEGDQRGAEEGREEGTATASARTLELGVVRDEKVYLLEESDVATALKAGKQT